MPTAHVQAQINAAKAGNSAPAARSQPSKGKTSDDPNEGHSAQGFVKLQQARAEAVGVGRAAWENGTFGVPCFYRKYRLLDAGQAAALDQLFYALTGTHP